VLYRPTHTRNPYMTAVPRPKLTIARQPNVDYIPRQSGKYTITPELAVLWLNHCNNPRHISPGIVEAYARDIKAGTWPESGETIKWDVDDECFDGEQRLRACVLAGVPIESWVIVGLPKQARDVVDQGYKRTLSQVLRNSGERYGRNLSGSATLLWRWNQGREALINTKIRPTITELKRLIDKNPQLKVSTELVHGSYAKASRLSRSSTVPTLIHFIGSANQGELATEFIAQVHYGKDLTVGEPAFTLREKLIQLNAEKNRFSQLEMLGLWIPAWNARAQGKKIRRIHPVDFNDPDALEIY
jgi:hypothetical protein